MGSRTSQLDLAVARYVSLLSVARRPNTVLRYGFALRLFVRYLKREHPQLRSFKQLRRVHIENWLRDLATRISHTGSPLQNSTRRVRIIMVRRFLDDISAWEWDCAPKVALFQKGDMPPQDRLLPKPLSPDVDRQLQKALRSRGGLVPTALLLMRATGLRCQEFLDLKTDALEKVSESRWTLRVPLGKLHSERLLPVDAKTAKIFDKLLRLRGNPPPVPDPLTGKPVHFLLAHKDGRPRSRWPLRRVLIAAAQEAGIQEAVYPHRMRHTYATEMLRAGISLPVVMRLLGHRSIGMTMRYVQITQEDIQRQYEKAMKTIADRYPLTVSLPNLQSDEASAPDRFLSFLKSAASLLESIRRDNYTSPRPRKVLQRLVERIRRLARDFEGLST